MFTQDNDFGCVKVSGVSDMTETDGTLLQQIQKARIEYMITNLAMGAVNSDPCYLLHYTTKSNVPMTVLVFPQSGIDSWAEDYFHFAHMTVEDAWKLDWSEIYDHVQRISHETAMKNIQVAQYCKSCHKAPVETYDDLRGKKRCKTCHTHTEDNKAEFWK